MAGTVTNTEITSGYVRVVKFAWTASADGAADATTTALFSGQVQCAVIVPGTGDDAPTDAYDVVVTNNDSVDVLYGLGADSSGTVPVVVRDAGWVKNSALTLAVTNAGNANKGTVLLYIA